MVVPHDDGSYTVIGEGHNLLQPSTQFCARFTKEGDLVKKELVPFISGTTGISTPTRYAWLNDSIVGFVLNNISAIYRINVNTTSFLDPISIGQQQNIVFGTIKKTVVVNLLQEVV